MEIYRRTGRIFQKRHEMFVELSWFFVMHGMGLKPQSYDPLVDASDWQEVTRVMQGMRQKVATDTAAAPTHDSFFPEQIEAAQPAGGWAPRRQAI
jgi:tryptophan halogenase